ncbi:MAG: site-specific DNA-methyltransferase [Pseudomonadota bacterium]|nr:site-specific DNA-methyltransferase [Pseudomonadota bacterium]
MKPVIIGHAKLYHMDCMDLLRATPDKYFGLACVDPPYGIGMAGGKVGNSRVDYRKFAGNDLSIPDAEYFSEPRRVSVNQIIWGANYMTDHLPPSPCFIVWDKVQPAEFSMAMAEYAWASFDSPAKIFRQRVVGANKWRIHPTEKPIRLYEFLLTHYAKPGQRILDTHLGSGSSAIAANNFGFDFTGIELDKDYFDAACERIENAYRQQRMFP